PPTPPYPLSLHDALPISVRLARQLDDLRADEGRYHDQEPWPGSLEYGAHTHGRVPLRFRIARAQPVKDQGPQRNECRARDQREADRKSTRLNSSHVSISY